VARTIIRRAERRVVALKDADRLANIGPNIFIRSGQFYPLLPPFDPRHIDEFDPQSTYRSPRNVLDDIRYCLEWEEWLRKRAENAGASQGLKFAEPFKRLVLG